MSDEIKVINLADSRKNETKDKFYSYKSFLENDEVSYNVPWIISETHRNDKVTYTIIHGILAEHIIKTKKILFIRNSAMENVFIYIYENGVYNLISDIEFKGIILKYIPLDLQKSHHSNQVFEIIIQHAKYIKQDDLNPERYINFKDGLFDIKTWKFEEHNSNIYSTIQINCNCPYNINFDFNNYKSKIFDKYLNDLSSGNIEKKSLILQFMGITISNIAGYRLKKSLFMYGAGDSGKSKIKELLGLIIGNENYSGIDLSDLEKRFGSSQIYGKRLIGSNDMSFLTVDELKTFKKIIGGDTIPAEFKGQNGFNFIFKGVAWFCCNELPKFGGDKGNWVYDRIIPLECNNSIPKEKQIKMIVEKMFKEKEYIIWLVLNELKKVIDNNLEYIIPKECKNNIDKYKIDNNSFLSFMNECTEKRIDNNIKDNCTCKKLYDVYVEWCKDHNNGYKETKQECKKILTSLGQDNKKKINGYFYWSDFTLNLSTKKDYSRVYGDDNNIPNFDNYNN